MRLSTPPETGSRAWVTSNRLRNLLTLGAIVATVAVGCSVLPSAQHLPQTSSKPSPTANLPAPSPTITPTLSPAATASPTLDPYADVTVDSLSARTYGGGELQVLRTTQPSDRFERISFNYPSDGLSIRAFMNVPTGRGPFPVVLVLHGYVDPDEYRILAYTTRYANALARAGYIAIHPNYRNHPPSDSGPNSFRTGYAIDVLNLIALVREHAGEPGPLQKADPSAIGLLGHSMGGGIALRTITVDAGIRAAVLYGSVSGDERQNILRRFGRSGGQSGRVEITIPEDDLNRISPFYHLDGVQAAVSIHHGAADDVVPPEWSDQLCQELENLNKDVECFSYPGALHTFYGRDYDLFMDRVRSFFRRTLR